MSDLRPHSQIRPGRPGCGRRLLQIGYSARLGAAANGQELRLLVGHPKKPRLKLRPLREGLRMGQKLPTILQIIPQLDAGGAELSAVEIADAVVRAGGRAIVLAEPGRLAADIAKVGGEVMPFPAATKNPLRMLANAGAIARIVRREHVDLVHARSRAPAWSAHAGGAAHRRAVRDHLSRRLRREERRQAALQQRDGAGRRGDRQFPLHRAPDRRALRDAGCAHRGDPARRRRGASSTRTRSPRSGSPPCAAAGAWRRTSPSSCRRPA